MKNDEFDAYKYANEFEILSLEIISIVFFDGDKQKKISEKVHTQETRDNGVDGYIKFKINGSSYTYTVEAKLRTCDTLGLKDFASSVLNSLINFSTRHFVVTNILYSKDAVAAIENLNAQKKGNIDLIDGRRLQDIINKKMNLFSKYPNILVDYIMNRSLKNTIYKSDSTAFTAPLETFTIYTEYLESCKKNIIEQYEKGERFFIVEGCANTGKTTFIENVIHSLCEKYNKVSNVLDMEILSTPRLILSRIIEIVSGINILSLLDFLSKEDTDEILSASSKEISILNDLGTAIKILFDPNAADEDEQVFYLNELLKKAVSTHYFSEANILYFRNLDKSTSKQLFFLLKILKIFPSNGIAVFLELLKPFQQCEVQYIPLNNWFEKSKLFKTSKYGTHVARVISLQNYSSDEKIQLLKKCKEINSYSFITELSKELGDVPGNFHLGLKYVLEKKLFSVPLLKNFELNIHSSNMLFEMFFSEFNNNLQDKELIQSAIVIAYLLDDIVPEHTIYMLSKEYNCDARINILNSPFFSLDYNIIKIVDRQIYKITNLIAPSVIKEIGGKILTEIDNIYTDEYEKTYFICYLNVCICNEINEELIKKVIINLKNRNAIARIDKLLDGIYCLMEYKNYSIIDKLKLIVYYINFVNKQYLYNTKTVCSFLTKAEGLYNELEDSFEYNNEEDSVRLQLDYCQAMYYRQKMLYNYDKCQQFVNEILKYENSFPQFEKQYINAHIWQALIYKEHGCYRQEFKEYIETIRKFPNNFKVKKSFLINAAAYYYFRSPEKALAILEDLISTIRENKEDYRNNLWVYHDWIMVKMYNNQYDMEFLYKIRNIAERCNASNVLTRNFNMEGYYYIKQKSYEAAKACFETAVIISETAGKNKVYFLFLTNLISVKKIMNLDIKDELLAVNNWLYEHAELINERLKKTKKRENENLFAALTSCILACKNVKDIGDTIKEQINTTCFDFSKVTNLLECVHPMYWVDDNIFILF